MSVETGIEFFKNLAAGMLLGAFFLRFPINSYLYSRIEDKIFPAFSAPWKKGLADRKFQVAMTFIWDIRGVKTKALRQGMRTANFLAYSCAALFVTALTLLLIEEIWIK